MGGPVSTSAMKPEMEGLKKQISKRHFFRGTKTARDWDREAEAIKGQGGSSAAGTCALNLGGWGQDGREFRLIKS